MTSRTPKLLFRKHVLVAMAVIGVIAVSPSPARADTVTATFSIVSPGEIVTIHNGSTTESGWAGVYKFINASGALSGTLTTYCIDIGQNISFGQPPVTFTIDSLSNAPVDSNPNTAAMGDTRAELIRELWYNDFALVGTDRSKAAAFQIAIWEIINETSTNTDVNHTLKLDVNSGSFRVSQYSTGQSTTTFATANTWLAALDLSGAGPMAGGLIALTSEQYQDYVVQTPAPSSLLLGIIGTAALLLFQSLRLRRAGRALLAAFAPLASSSG